jgi:transposase
MGQRFTPTIVAKLRRAHGLSSRYERLRRKGLLTKAEIAKELDVHWSTIGVWHQHGLLKGYDYNDKGERLYELPPEEQRPAKLQGRKLAERAIKTKVPPHAANKVQHDA